MTIPRRTRVDLMTPEELTCRTAIAAIENMPHGDPLLTEAQTLIARAQAKLADFIDRNDESQKEFIGFPKVTEIFPTTSVCLIEAPGNHYLGFRKSDHMAEFCWVADRTKAIRFLSKEDARCAARALRMLAPHLWGFVSTLGESRISEHVFISAPPEWTTVAQDRV